MNEQPEFKIGDQMQFPPYTNIWVVVKLVERGVILEQRGPSPHRHLCEWALLETATKL